MKCISVMQEISILGHVLGDSGVRMSPEKVTETFQLKTTPNRKELKSFFGLDGYGSAVVLEDDGLECGKWFNFERERRGLRSWG